MRVAASSTSLQPHRTDREHRKPVKGARWLPLKNRDLLLAGILAHCRYPLGTNLIEGINNKIKVIKRMACDFRDDASFFLKIRAAFPGLGR